MRRNRFGLVLLKGGLFCGIAAVGLGWLPSAHPARVDTPALAADIEDPDLQNRLQQVLKRAAARSKRNPGAALLAVSILGSGEKSKQPATSLVASVHGTSDDAPVFPNTPFGLASVTKTMVAALTFIYAERGLLELDTPILRLTHDDSWLLDHVSNPQFRRALDSTTLRDFLAHRSGLADYWEDEKFLEAWQQAKDKKWRPTELVDWAGENNPVCAPKSCFRYSDTNYVIVGLALEQLTGMRLDEQLRTELFEPLHMRCSWMFFEERAPQGCLAPTHAYEGGLDVTGNRMQSADWSGGGVYSTLDDQLKFLRALFSGRLISKKSLAEMQHWGDSDLGEGIVYGLGLYKTSAGSGMTLIGHTGVHNAFSFFWVEAGVLITGSLNQSDNEALDNLVFPVVRVIHEASAIVDHSQ